MKKTLQPTTYNLQTSGGFSLIELLIVLAIVAIMTALVLGSLSKYKDEQTLRTESLAIVSIINNAKSKTLASLESSVYGVRVESNSIISFKGAVYFANDPANQTHNLPENLSIGNISINGGNNIIFKRLTGDTDSTGSFRIVRSSDASKFRTVSIISNGQITLN